jgi:hypothetical protein
MKKHQTTLKRTLQKIGTQTFKAKIITGQGIVEGQELKIPGTGQFKWTATDVDELPYKLELGDIVLTQ